MTLPETYGYFGRHSRGHNHTLDALWAECDKLNRESGESVKGEFVPSASICVDPTILPRMCDPETVMQYALTVRDWPPIIVQRDTFVLLDGKHRLEATLEAKTPYIRIQEGDGSLVRPVVGGVALQRPPWPPVHPRHGHEFSPGGDGEGH